MKDKLICAVNVFNLTVNRLQIALNDIRLVDTRASFGCDASMVQRMNRRSKMSCQSRKSRVDVIVMV